jgi:hypothetical protein
MITAAGRPCPEPLPCHLQIPWMHPLCAQGWTRRGACGVPSQSRLHTPGARWRKRPLCRAWWLTAGGGPRQGLERQASHIETVTMFFRELTYNVVRTRGGAAWRRGFACVAPDIAPGRVSHQVYSLTPYSFDESAELAAIHLQLACGNAATRTDVE